ncbi:MAG: DUF4387 domain-containing protein [SAR324 cluster bacterium]|nr:DUF4387 domain-containing protein [SAR324 cluster bacterium]
MAKIKDIALVCKSKNAGPFEVTIDVVFAERETFDRVKACGVLTRERVAALYNVAPEDVLFTVYEPALAFKATLPRLIPAGDSGDTDVYGCQQHAPLLELDLPI